MPLAADRRVRILERVAEGASLQVADLAREFGCSEMTIRRDIQRLERDGFLRRTYGGATAHLTRSLDVAFNARALANAAAKRLIGLTAARLVDAEANLFVGIGTTAEQFARYLPARVDLTVVTPSLPIAGMLGTRPGRAVIVGGTVRRDELCSVGPAARATLERYHFDIAVLGTAGLTARWGVTDLSDEDAEVMRVAAERSARVVVIADGTKLGQTAPAIVVPASSVHTLVTDPSAPAAELDRLREVGVEIVIAPAGARRHAEAQADQATEA
jgi:DeoR family transcriptional regulator, aga operon transcriptional repressor